MNQSLNLQRSWSLAPLRQDSSAEGIWKKIVFNSQKYERIQVLGCGVVLLFHAENADRDIMTKFQ